MLRVAAVVFFIVIVHMVVEPGWGVVIVVVGCPRKVFNRPVRVFGEPARGFLVGCHIIHAGITVIHSCGEHQFDSVKERRVLCLCFIESVHKCLVMAEEIVAPLLVANADIL